MFLHADIFHILFNMYFLYIFGREVESILGRWRYLALYFIGGIAASIFHIGFSGIIGLYNVLIPALGASGAISSVLGASLLLYPHRRMTVCWFFWFIPWCFDIRTVYLLLFWFATQVIYGFASASGVAFFAHSGGFVAGIVLLAFLIPSHLRRRKIQSIYNFFTGEYILVRREGIGSTEKMIFIILLVFLLLGGFYSYLVGGSYKGDIYVYTVSVGYGGNIDYDYAIYSPTKGVISSPESDLPRIVWNRLYWGGLINGDPRYNGTINIDREVHVSEYDVDIRLSLHGRVAYDASGVLIYASGRMKTDVIIVRGNRLSLERNIFMNLEVSGYGPLTRIGSGLIQPMAILSLFIIASSIYVVWSKDKELVLD